MRLWVQSSAMPEAFQHQIAKNQQGTLSHTKTTIIQMCKNVKNFLKLDYTENSLKIIFNWRFETQFLLPSAFFDVTMTER